MPAAPDPPVDPSAYSNLDVLGTIRAFGPWWQLLVAGLDGEVADRNPPAGGPSFEDLAVEQAALLQHTLTQCGVECDDPTIDGLAGAVHAAVAGRVASSDVRPMLDDLLVRSMSLLRSAGRTLAATGALGAAASGEVAGLFASGGGVPKLPIPTVDIRADGVIDDRQGTRRHHGRPWQALCLWSAEVVARLSAEGHPIAPGSAGENISVRGLDWAAVRPGTRLRLGPDVVAEISVFALPCKQNARWFLDGEFLRMHHERESGVSRVYASVLQDGALAVGDPVVLLP